MLHDFKGLVGKIVTEGFSHPLPPSDASALYCSMVVNRKVIILINLSPHKPIRLSLSLFALLSPHKSDYFICRYNLYYFSELYVKIETKMLCEL